MKLHIGQVVIIKAWWNRNKLTECIIKEIWGGGSSLIVVKPNTGNLHLRVTDTERIIKDKEK